MSPSHKPLVWLGVELKSPPLSHNARLEAGFLLRQLQKGISLEMPQSRPMPVIGSNCHELRIQDEGLIWRIFYRIDRHAIVLIEALAKKTPTTPKPTIDLCIARLKRYDHESN